MDFLVDFYFGLGFFFGFLNFYYLVNSEGLLGEPDSTSVSELSSYLLSSIFVRIPYLLWIILGFLSSQWLLFGVMIIVTSSLFLLYKIIEVSLIKIFIFKSSLFLEFLFVVFVCLNHFHFEIKVFEFVL